MSNASEVLGSTPMKIPVAQSDSVFILLLLLVSSCLSLKFTVSPNITIGSFTLCPVIPS